MIGGPDMKVTALLAVTPNWLLASAVAVVATAATAAGVSGWWWLGRLRHDEPEHAANCASCAGGHAVRLPASDEALLDVADVAGVVSHRD